MNEWCYVCGSSDVHHVTPSDRVICLDCYEELRDADPTDAHHEEWAIDTLLQKGE